MSPLFVRGRPVLKIRYDSGVMPKCNILLLTTHLRSCRTMFTESKVWFQKWSPKLLLFVGQPFGGKRLQSGWHA